MARSLQSRWRCGLATVIAFVGIAVYFASNTALSRLALSDPYAAATAEMEKTILVEAGQALLALNRFSSPGGHPDGPGYISLLLLAVAGLITSIVMLRSVLFHRISRYLGVMANVLDLAYCIAYVFVPTASSDVFAIYLLPAVALFLVLWHILVGWQLLQLGRLEGQVPAKWP